MENESKVAVSRRKVRIWDKRDFCPFCYKEITHFARHVERNHKGVPKVQKILSLSKGSIERKQLWDCLRKEGNFYLFQEEKKLLQCVDPLKMKQKMRKSLMILLFVNFVEVFIKKNFI